jgi:hypothetical protein
VNDFWQSMNTDPLDVTIGFACSQSVHSPASVIELRRTLSPDSISTSIRGCSARRPPAARCDGADCPSGRSSSTIEGVPRPVIAACACLVIAQLNYAKCGSDQELKRAPSRQSAELTADEVRQGCAISSVWPDLHMVEIRCPPSREARRYCTDGAKIGAFNKKNGLLVNCLIEPGKK